MLDALPRPEASFASDNAAGAHPAVMEAVIAANEGSALAYGDDPWTQAAEGRLRDLFDADAGVLFCFGGTGANVVALSLLLGPGDAVVCPAGAHIAVDECGAPERFCGAKLIGVPTEDGKLRPAQLRVQLGALGDQHHVQPAVVSITQTTEVGTRYTPEEVAELAELAHSHGLAVHLDGARIANAAAGLGGDVAAFTTRAGVDVVSFGGTKNGGIAAEAVVLLRPDLVARGPFARKAAGQLPSKMRFVAAQFGALLDGGRWLELAGHANAMATRLAEAVAAVEGVEVVQAVEANAVFARLPAASIEALQEWSFFWVWDPRAGVVRWMTSWATTESDVDRFAAAVSAAVTGS